MPQLRALRSLLPLVFCAIFGLTSTHAYAQASATASRGEDLSVFGGYVNGVPDYGPYRNNGAAFGLDFTQYIHFPIKPAIEARANILSGKTVNEHTYLFGIRGQGNVFHHYYPYADFLAGPGNIHFNFNNNGYLGDNSIVYSYGGGVDIDLIGHFQAKIDFQGQHWKTGNAVTLTPSILLLGITYHIPFRPHIRQSDFHK